MRLLHIFGLAAAIGLGVGAGAMPASSGAPHYDAAGRFIFPADYRDWVFLSSSLDMSYAVNLPAGVHIFSNVFAPREAYASFLKNGVWPDKTVLLTEHRLGATNVSIVKRGQIQTANIVAFEAHVKDARFKGHWAFFGSGGDRKPAREIPHNTACYSCHQQHAAADTTFVQFYPTLLPVAAARKTLNPSYLAETAAPRSN